MLDQTDNNEADSVLFSVLFIRLEKVARELPSKDPTT
jgi:hypothetical protein